MSATVKKIIEGNYLNDLLGQGNALRAVRLKLAEAKLSIPLSNWKKIVLTGMGSSLHAQYPIHRKLCQAGFASHWIETAELLLGFEPYYNSETLLIVVSQSGESAEVVQLLQRSKEFGHIVGVTNNPDSTVGRTADTLLTLEAGEESTVSCKTYLATVAVLHWLATYLTNGSTAQALQEMEAAETAVRDYLAIWRDHVAELPPQLEGIRDIFVTGRGDSLATAGTGGLILKEATRLHAEGMSPAAFRHGPLEMADASVLVLIYEGDESIAPLHRRLAEDIVRGGGNAALIGKNAKGVFKLPQVPESILPIVEILPIQMLSLALAARDGFEAGRFQRASKITNIS